MEGYFLILICAILVDLRTYTFSMDVKYISYIISIIAIITILYFIIKIGKLIKSNNCEFEELLDTIYPLFYDLEGGRDKFYHYGNLIKKLIYGLVLVYINDNGLA